jgi:hypothetical protein
MSLNFIKACRNDKWYNKRVLIWCFTLVLIKINYGQIGDQTGLFYTTNPVFYTGQSVRWKPMFFRTELIFTGFVHWTGMFGNLCCTSGNVQGKFALCFSKMQKNNHMQKVFNICVQHKNMFAQFTSKQMVCIIQISPPWI